MTTATLADCVKANRIETVQTIVVRGITSPAYFRASPRIVQIDYSMRVSYPSAQRRPCKIHK